MFDQVADDTTYERRVVRWQRRPLACRDDQGRRPAARGSASSTSQRAPAPRATPLAGTGAHVVAADFSPGMIEVGRKRQDGSAIEFVFADAQALPFADDEFDAVTISFGLRNVGRSAPRARRDVRVTKPGGRIVICEFSKPPLAPFRVRVLRLPRPRDADDVADRVVERPRVRLPRRLHQGVGATEDARAPGCVRPGSGRCGLPEPDGRDRRAAPRDQAVRRILAPRRVWAQRVTPRGGAVAARASRRS